MKNDQLFELVKKAATAETNKKCAEAGQVTLGELVAKLEGVDRAKLVTFDDGTIPGSFHSYRGYYEMVAIDKCENWDKCFVNRLLQMAKKAIGQTFDGYKGGAYTMTKMTPIWVSEYGDNSGIAIIDVDTTGDVVILKTAKID